MHGLLFVSQAILDTWAVQGKIDLAGNTLTVVSGAGQGRSYVLVPAWRFVQLIGAEADPHGLLHRVKRRDQLEALGAEVMADTVVLGEVAYQVDPGFLAEAAALQAAAASRGDPARAASRAPTPVPGAPGPAGAAPSPREQERRADEADSLARYLLERLS